MGVQGLICLSWDHVVYLGSPGVTCLSIFLIYYPHITISMSQGILKIKWRIYVYILHIPVDCCHSVTQSRPTLCSPKDCSPPGSSVYGIIQARILQWVAMPSSRGFSKPRNQTSISQVSCIGRQVLWHQRHQRSLHIYVNQFSLVTESCLTLCDAMDCSTPGLPVHHQLPEFTQTHIH